MNRWIVLIAGLGLTSSAWAKPEFLLAPGGYLIDVHGRPADNAAIAFDDATGTWIPQTAGGLSTSGAPVVDNSVPVYVGTGGTSIEDTPVTIDPLTGAMDGIGSLDADSGVSAPSFTDETASSATQVVNLTGESNGDILSYNSGWTRFALGAEDRFLMSVGGALSWRAASGDVSLNDGAFTLTDVSIITAKGDLLVGDGSGNADNIGVGLDGKVLKANSAATYGVEWADDNTGAGTSLTTKGDLQGFDTANAAVPVGTNGQVLRANSADAQGVDYATPAGDVAGPITSLELGDNVVELADMADESVGIAEIVDGTDGQLITWDSSGEAAAFGPGTSGQVVMSNGNGAAPTFESSSGDVTGAYTNLQLGSQVVGTAELTDLGVATGDIANNAVTLGKQAVGTPGGVIAYATTTGAATDIGAGTTNQLLRSNGSSTAGWTSSVNLTTVQADAFDQDTASTDADAINLTGQAQYDLLINKSGGATWGSLPKGSANTFLRVNNGGVVGYGALNVASDDFGSTDGINSALALQSNAVETSIIENLAVTLGKMANGTPGGVIGFATTTGAATDIGAGSSGQVLRSNGTSTPSWGAAGKLAQVVISKTATVYTITTDMNDDNTIPQNTEGDAITNLDTTITPTNASSTLYIIITFPLEVSDSNGRWNTALFRDSTASAIHATSVRGQGNRMNVMLIASASASSTSATTFKCRVGDFAASGTGYVNGASTTSLFGLVCSSMMIAEVLP